MTLLRSGELTAMRAVQAQALGDSGVYHRLSTSQNGIGETVEAWAAAGTASCRLSSLSASDIPRVAALRPQVQLNSAWRLTWAHGTDVRPGDKVVIDSDTYDVIDVDKDGAWHTAVRCYVQHREAQ